MFSSPCYSVLDTAFLHKRMSPKSSTPKPRTSLIVVYLELVKASGAVHFIGMSVIFEALYTVEKKRRAKLFFTSLVYLLSTKFFMFTFFLLLHTLLINTTITYTTNTSYNTNHKNYNFLARDWFKNVLFSTNSLAKLLSDSLLLDCLLLDSLLSDSLISQSHSKM